MSVQGTPSELDPEISAITQVYLALKPLDSEARTRVIEYVSKKLKLEIKSTSESHETTEDVPSADENLDFQQLNDDEDDDLAGISPVAKKWISRNGLKADQLGSLFSLGIDEIDLVAKKVPGKSKKEKMRSVLLLKGAAAYLSTGAPRITYDQLKEASTHYDAYDAANFATYMKSMSSEVSGSKEGGFTLTARGLNSATEIVKELTKE